MPYYYSLKHLPKKERCRAVAGLQRLRAQLDAEMPRKSLTDSVILGTWNIRNFDDNRFRNGTRGREDLFYLAEIISRFDIIAVQEICEDLGPLDDLLQILGRKDYAYILTDPTEGKAGNDERLGFIYDRKKVWFKGIAGELVLPDGMEIVDGERKRQFSRTPFMCSFQCGWFKFLFSTVHIYFGDSSGPKYERRIEEIDSVSKFLARRAEKDDRNHVLVGDFNIKRPGSRGFNALYEHGFTIFQNITGSNKDQTKYYDQISFRTREGELRPATGQQARGVFQFFDSIFRPVDFKAYAGDLRAVVRLKIDRLKLELEREQRRLARARSESGKARARKRIEKLKENLKDWRAHLPATAAGRKKLKAYYLNEWRTFHASDHLPLWVELKIDFSAEYLEELT